MDYLTRLDDSDFAFDIEYMVFPLLESISFNLFGKSVRYYLEELGLSSKEANILVAMFRNGVIHNNHYYEMQYDDGKIIWGVQSGGGTAGITPYDPGYQDPEQPENNMPADKFFEYNELAETALQRIANKAVISKIAQKTTEQMLDNLKVILES